MCIKIHAGLLNTLWLVPFCCIHVNLTNRNYVKFPYTSCKAQSNMMIHHNHFPVSFYLSVWHLFWNIICVQLLLGVFGATRFSLSETPQGLNILQTYLSMRFCSSLGVTQNHLSFSYASPVMNWKASLVLYQLEYMLSS